MSKLCGQYFFWQGKALLLQDIMIKLEGIVAAAPWAAMLLMTINPYDN